MLILGVWALQLTHNIGDNQVMEDCEFLRLFLCATFEALGCGTHLELLANVSVELQVLLNCIIVTSGCNIETTLVKFELLGTFRLSEDHAALLNQHLAAVKLFGPQVVGVFLETDLV